MSAGMAEASGQSSGHIRCFILLAAITVALLMIVSLPSFVAESSADKTISLTISDAEVDSGDEFEITIIIDSNPGIWALGLSLEIPDCVSLIDVTSGDILPVGWPEKAGLKTVKLYGENSSLKDVTGIGVFATLTLKAEKTDTCLSGTISCAETDCTDLDGEDVTVSISGGIIKVHTWEETGRTDPTCESDGKIDYICTGCLKEKSDAIPATGHSWSEWMTVKEPTSEEDGLEQRVCSVCDKSEQKVIPRTVCDHEWTDSGKGTEPSCEKDGERILVCSKCSEEKHETIPATGHSWSEWMTVKEPTSEEDGLEQRVCSVCGETEDKVIPKTEPSSDNMIIYVLAVVLAAVIGALIVFYLVKKRP